jgi:hypothetical protein
MHAADAPPPRRGRAAEARPRCIHFDRRAAAAAARRAHETAQATACQPPAPTASRALHPQPRAHTTRAPGRRPFLLTPKTIATWRPLRVKYCYSVSSRRGGPKKGIALQLNAF